jgi:hypothetical protein
MKVYVFGNRDIREDAGAIEVAEGLRGAVDGVSFVFVEPNGDVPFANEERVVIPFRFVNGIIGACQRYGTHG